ncbi:MAG: hypothetical protein U0169_17835 [Polyangiaceae bacterium]
MNVLKSMSKGLGLAAIVAMAAPAAVGCSASPASSTATRVSPAKRSDALVSELLTGNGQLGTLNVATPIAVNHYAELATSAVAGDTAVTVQNPTGTFAVGQLVMVWQVTGIPNSDPSVASGNAVPLDLASSDVGRHEFGRVVAVNGNQISFAEGLTRNYAAGGATQIVFVPEYTDVTILATGRVIPQQAWDGAKGGVVAFLASGTLTNDGDVSADAAGFRGGLIENSDPVGTNYSRGCDALDGFAPGAGGANHPEFGGARKGEGPVTGTFTATNGGPALAYGKGNRATGAGGGNCTNSGGGGGGHGAPGGRGGLVWPGDGSRRQGGFGGSALVPNGVTWSFGGGGGGGETNDANGADGSGGAGGGLVFVRARTIAGTTGTYSARGATGEPNPNDGAGGGGAGGTVVLEAATSVACQSVSVVGGNGNVGGHGTPDGSSGGGGGGRAQILAGTTTACSVQAAGGTAGAADANPGLSGTAPNGANPANAGTCTGGTSADCTSGACDVGDGLCGLTLGATCTADHQCRVGICGAGGRCGLANGALAADAAQCRSGVRHTDGRCGRPNDTGGCTNGDVCRSGVCDPTAGGGTGLCRQCLPNDKLACTGATNVCDAVTFTCVACNGDLGTNVSAACPGGAPYCPGNGGACSASCGTAGTTASCTSGGGVTHAGPICQATGVCGVGCVSDANCGSSEWCDTNAQVCTAKAATGQAIPGGGTCASGTSNRCTSGVCDADGVCGHANGLGDCTPGNASGANGTCRSGVCDGSANAGAGLCRECVVGNTANCTGGTPICDTTSQACVACNGDNGTSATATCPANAPYCPGNGGACTTCTPAGSGTQCTAQGATHAGPICQANGACASSCVDDTNCSNTQFCDTGVQPSATCAARLANGTAIPTVAGRANPTIAGTCTVAVGAIVCASSVCDADDACGYRVGTGPCTANTGSSVCRSGVCSTDGTCMPAGGCNVNADCGNGFVCSTAHTCVGAGVDAGTDGSVEAGSDDGGGVDGGTTEGGTVNDGGASDSGRTDGGAVDSGARDGSVADASVTDGSVMRDAATVADATTPTDDAGTTAADAAPNGTTLEGGGVITCTTSTPGTEPGPFGAVGLVAGLAVLGSVRRRRHGAHSPERRTP